MLLHRVKLILNVSKDYTLEQDLREPCMIVCELAYDRECIILSRRNKFVVEVLVGEDTSTAYLANTGKLQELVAPGRKGYCVRRERGRTKYRLLAVEDRGFAALIDTAVQELVFKTMIDRGLIPWLAGCSVAGRNIRVGSSVLDYMLLCRGEKVFVELKSAALRGPRDTAMYPDTPSGRGRRHVAELIRLAEKGVKTLLVFMAAFPGAKAFTPNRSVDEKLYELVKQAVSKGVLVKAIGIHYDPGRMSVVLESTDLPVIL